MTEVVHSVRVYPGENDIIFNMVWCHRMKKKDPTKISERWSINYIPSNLDLLTSLVVRIRYSEYPWIAGYYGARQIFKSPIIVPIRAKQDVDGSEVTIYLRDSTDRGENCINRKFVCCFSSALDANVFMSSYMAYFKQKYGVICDNLQNKKSLLSHAVKKRKFKGGDDGNDGNDSGSSTYGISSGDNKDKNIDEDADSDDDDNKKQPPLKKARFLSPLKKAAETSTKDEDKEDEKNEEHVYGFFKTCFDEGDFRNELDNQFEDTQDPFEGCHE